MYFEKVKFFLFFLLLVFFLGFVSAGCEPDCYGKICGDDGCGGSCGKCASDEYCYYGRQCVQLDACVIDCSGKECGDDGCGGSCGSCSDYEVCDEYTGQCFADEGSYDGFCEPDCSGKECGDDGCGGFCGYCYYPSYCDYSKGICIGGDSYDSDPYDDYDYLDDYEPYEPYDEYDYYDDYGSYDGFCESDCSGKECGGDGCDGSCGYCYYPAYCDYSSGTCVGGEDCEPDCSGKECGGDGCGGSCGYCSYPAYCDYYDGLCIDDDPYDSYDPYDEYDYYDNYGDYGDYDEYDYYDNYGDYDGDDVDLSGCTPVGEPDLGPCICDDSESSSLVSGYLISDDILSISSFFYEERSLDVKEYNPGEKLTLLGGLLLDRLEVTGDSIYSSFYDFYFSQPDCLFDCEEGEEWDGERCSSICDESDCQEYDAYEESCVGLCDGCHECVDGECEFTCSYEDCEQCSGWYSQRSCVVETPKIDSGTIVDDPDDGSLSGCSECFNGQLVEIDPNTNLCEECDGESIVSRCSDSDCEYCSGSFCISSCFFGLEECNDGVCENANSVSCDSIGDCTQDSTQSYECETDSGEIVVKEVTEQVSCEPSSECEGKNVCNSAGDVCPPPEGRMGCEKDFTFKNDFYDYYSSYVDDPEVRDVIREYKYFPSSGSYEEFSRIKDVCGPCESCDVASPGEGCVPDGNKDGAGCDYYRENPFTGLGEQMEGVCLNGVCEVLEGRSCSEQGEECGSCEYCRYFGNEQVLRDGNDVFFLNIPASKEIVEEIVVSNDFDSVIEYDVVFSGVDEDFSRSYDVSNFIDGETSGELIPGETKVLEFRHKTNFEDISIGFEVVKIIPEMTKPKRCLDFYYPETQDDCSQTSMRTESLLPGFRSVYRGKYASYVRTVMLDVENDTCASDFMSRYSNYGPAVLDSDKKVVCGEDSDIQRCVEDYVGQNLRECHTSYKLKEDYNFVFKSEPKKDSNGTCEANPFMENKRCAEEFNGYCKKFEYYSSDRLQCEAVEDECSSNSDCCSGYCSVGEFYSEKVVGGRVNNYYFRNVEPGERFESSFDLQNVGDEPVNYEVFYPKGFFSIGETEFTLMPGEEKEVFFYGLIDRSSGYLVGNRGVGSVKIKETTLNKQACGMIDITVDNPEWCSNCELYDPVVTALSEETNLPVNYDYRDMSGEDFAVSEDYSMSFTSSCGEEVCESVNDPESFALCVRQYVGQDPSCEGMDVVSNYMYFIVSRRGDPSSGGKCLDAPERSKADMNVLVGNKDYLADEDEILLLEGDSVVVYLYGESGCGLGIA